MAKGHRTKIKRERNAVKDTRPRAHGRYLKISDTKARIVLREIVKKPVAEASAILTYSPHYAARLIEKILDSAVANAENNLGLDPASLIVEEAYAGKGHSAQSRWRLSPRAKGQGYRIERQVSNVSIILNEKPLAANKK